MHRTIPALFALGLALSAPAARADAPPKPNIIFITSDDHRWDALGAAGNSAIHTPVLDRLAARGIYFRQATTYVSQCHPIRATLLTGLPVHQHGAFSVQRQSAEAAKWVDPRGPDGVTIIAPYEQYKPDAHPGLVTGVEPAPLQLFDLQADPSEQRDVAAEHPDVVARLKQAHASLVQSGR